MFGIAIEDRQRAFSLWSRSATALGTIVTKHLADASLDDIHATARKAAHYGLKVLDYQPEKTS